MEEALAIQAEIGFPTVIRPSFTLGGSGGGIAYNREEFLDMERSFWLTHAPIGFVFGLGTVIGFIVGMVICYQVLSSDVVDHLAENDAHALAIARRHGDRWGEGAALKWARLEPYHGYRLSFEIEFNIEMA